MNKTLIAGLVLALLFMLSPLASGQTYCLNATWSRTAIALDEENFLIDEYCPYNCSDQTQRCNPGYPNSTESFMIVMGLVAIAALLLYISIKLDKKYWEVQFLFLFLALFMILTSIYLISNLQNLSWTQANTVITTNYTVVMWSIIIFLFVVIIKFIVDVFQNWIKTHGKKSRRKK